MTFISRRRRFIEELIVNGCEAEEALWLADLEFDGDDPRPGSIYETYRTPEA